MELACVWALAALFGSGSESPDLPRLLWTPAPRGVQGSCRGGRCCRSDVQPHLVSLYFHLKPDSDCLSKQTVNSTNYNLKMPCSYFKAVWGFILIAGPAPTVMQLLLGHSWLLPPTPLRVDPDSSHQGPRSALEVVVGDKVRCQAAPSRIR